HTHLMEAFLTMERVADSVERSGRHPVISLFTDGLPDDAGNQELALLAGTDTASHSQNLFNAVSADEKNHGMPEWWMLAGTIFCFMVVISLLLKHRRSKHKNSPHLSMGGPTRIKLVTKNKSPMSFDIEDLLANKLSIGSSVNSDIRLFNAGNYQLIAETNQNRGIDIIFGSSDGKDGFKLIVENIVAHK
ncbi:MAG: hypothetical protein M1378_01360, partial [Bacteroidetes bacterium]|nr:hypothetical protein [Bacteroidota bacterium]